MNDNISPEEKLLRLIRQNKKPQEQKSSQAKVVLPAEVKSVNEPAQLKPTDNRAVLPKYKLKYLTTGFIQNIMITLVIIFSLYLGAGFYYSWFVPKKIKLAELKLTQAQKEEPQIKEEQIPLEEYSRGLKDRPIFSTLTLQAAAEIPAVAATEALKNISLVGIIAVGQAPQAVIEDKKAAKTYYVTRGQFIGEYQVEDIQEGKIILNYEGKKYELFI